MAKILEKVLMSYDALISERLNRTNLYPRKTRKCIGRHLRKGDPKSGFVVAVRYKNSATVVVISMNFRESPTES